MINNSQNQVNNDYQKLKDRYDVDKAWYEWKSKKITAYDAPSLFKSFAVFFAERVKGGKLI
jgi:hypothetical protein